MQVVKNLTVHDVHRMLPGERIVYHRGSYLKWGLNKLEAWKAYQLGLATLVQKRITEDDGSGSAGCFEYILIKLERKI